MIGKAVPEPHIRAIAKTAVPNLGIWPGPLPPLLNRPAPQPVTADHGERA